jgi:hypothetical protein
MLQKPLKEINGRLYVFDQVRKKYLLFTPEEEVRQRMLDLLIHTLHYPRGLLSVETGLKYNTRQKRTDIVVFDNSGKPYMIVECKRKEEKLGKEELFQLSVYNKFLQAEILILTNGIDLLCMKVDMEANKLVPLSEIPPYSIGAI